MGAPMAELPCPAAISTQCPDPPRILCLRCRWLTMASRLGAWSRRGPLRPRPGPGAAQGRQNACWRQESLQRWLLAFKASEQDLLAMAGGRGGSREEGLQVGDPEF